MPLSHSVRLNGCLEKLYFSSTSFSGRLAPLPINLVEFDCSYTMIDGGLTNEVFKGLNNLNFVLLDGNAFNASVPAVFGSLPNLEYLYISDAFISGDLSYMQGMPKMIEHWVDVNPGLKGTIPTFIGKITTLKSLSMSQGSLTGSLPTELGNLSNMIQMWFFANSLDGQIPSEIGSLSTLRTFQIEGNNIAGLVPPEICALREFPSALQILGSDCTLTGVSSLTLRVSSPCIILPHLGTLFLTCFPSILEVHLLLVLRPRVLQPQLCWLVDCMRYLSEMSESHNSRGICCLKMWRNPSSVVDTNTFSCGSSQDAKISVGTIE